MKSTHEKLEDTIKSEGFLLEQGGVCSSATLGGLQAFLNHTLTFYTNRIEYIDNEYYLVQQLKNNRLRRFRGKDDEPGYDSELHDAHFEESSKKSSELLNFLFILSVAQIPHYHPKIFKKSYTQQTAPEILEFIRSIETEKNAPMQELARQPGIYTRQELLCYLLILKYYALKHEQDLALYLGASTHTIGLCYDHKLNQWQILNINKFPFHASNFSCDVVDFLFEGFNDDFKDDLSEDEQSDYELQNETTSTCNQNECVAFETIFYTKEQNVEAGKRMVNDIFKDPVLKTIQITPDNDSPKLISTKSKLVTPNNTTLAYIAARYNHADVIKALNEQKGNLQQGITEDGSFPLYIAAQQGNLEAVKALVFSGVNINQLDERDYSPLCVAAQMGHLHIVQFLIEAGVQVQPLSENIPSPIFVAALENHTEIVQILLENGANPHASVIKGRLLMALGEAYEIGEQMKIFIERKLTQGHSADAIPVSAFEIAELKSNVEVLKIMNTVKVKTNETRKREKKSPSKKEENENGEKNLNEDFNFFAFNSPSLSISPETQTSCRARIMKRMPGKKS